MKNIIDSFDYFLKSNELGKTDAKNINRLLQMIDADGYIEKQVVLDELFKKAANADANYRNFVKRVRDAIDNAQAEDGDLTGRKILESIEVNIVKASKTQPTRLQLTTRYVAPIVVQPEANRQYDESIFQKNIAKDAGKKIDANDIIIFLSHSKEDERLVHDFQELFESRSPCINERSVKIWTMQELTFGGSFDQQIQQNLRSADFGLAALSQNFLKSEYIKEKEVSCLLGDNRLLLFGLDAKIDGKDTSADDFFTQMKEALPKGDLHQQTLQQQVCYLNDRKGNFFGDCIKEESKIKFVDKVISDLTKVMEGQEKTKQKEKKHIENSCNGNYEYDAFVPSKAKGMEVKNQSESLVGKDAQPDTPEYELIPDMLAWAQNSDQSIYAILGDYGMGKTFSCRIFAKELAGTKITPFYIDLRDTPTFVTKDNIMRQPLLEEIIDNVLGRQNIKTQAQNFIQQAQDGTLIFIFDGLDEKLVHYNQDIRQQFLSELMRVFPVDTFRSQSKVKMVLSCRTHHFEDLKAQSSFLRGLGRTDSASEDYRAVEILPFNALQIESLLEKQLGNKSRVVFELINDNRYLANLAKRPFLLTRIAQVLPTLQTLRVINSAAVYQALIDDAIDRDEGKHILHPRHKRILLQDLSAELWQQSEQILMVDELNEWYQSWLHRNTSILQQYDKVSNSELERDLRNSTLLVRFGEEDFGFTHSSMQEFFLAQWILKNWRQLLGDFKLNKAISLLTRQFILDSILLLKPEEIKQLKQALKDSLQQKNTTELTHLALDIVSTMSKEMGVTLDFECVDLSYLKVKQLFVIGLKTKELILSHSDLPASRWQNVEIATVKINDSNLNQSVWRDCVLQDLHTDFKIKTDDVLHSGMHQWTVDNCQFEFEHTAFSKALQWHIYINFHKLKTGNVQNLSQFDFLQIGHLWSSKCQL
ncbi:WD-repeat protein [Bathymodiolus thermophilus thioautotrophic gill symbiont]|uniref:TIR domain-containing protein n=1 Tax=Bathymodiolus thermophilus thioautotrophic gill symbiont TaxID=2360 RepID=UPI0010BADABE|nr:TIR domain-containing protein [Bathymodiolus thermophilus thioautotrophic gill symbiont]SHA10971.1 WD-repeat protein [Bathymodiolus thermophilus thioautotrophic gill symbiont]